MSKKFIERGGRHLYQTGKFRIIRAGTRRGMADAYFPSSCSAGAAGRRRLPGSTKICCSVRAPEQLNVSDLAAFSIDFRQQRRLLLRAPNPPSIRWSQNVDIAQKRLPLESRERLQRSANAPRASQAATRGRPNAYGGMSGFRDDSFRERCRTPWAKTGLAVG